MFNIFKKKKVCENCKACAYFSYFKHEKKHINEQKETSTSIKEYMSCSLGDFELKDFNPCDHYKYDSNPSNWSHAFHKLHMPVEKLK